MDDGFPFTSPVVFHVTHGHGWEDWAAPENVTVLFNMSMELELKKGWNLCSIPIILDDDSAAKLLAQGVFWGWSAGRFGLLESVSQGQGFWMFCEDDCVLELSGKEKKGKRNGGRRGDNSAMSVAVLRRGWNLLGKGVDGDLSKASAVFAVENGIMEYVEKTTDGYGLQSGKGYWIFVP
jgi:hypothetical protein